MSKKKGLHEKLRDFIMEDMSYNSNYGNWELEDMELENFIEELINILNE